MLELGEKESFGNLLDAIFCLGKEIKTIYYLFIPRIEKILKLVVLSVMINGKYLQCFQHLIIKAHFILYDY